LDPRDLKVFKVKLGHRGQKALRESLALRGFRVHRVKLAQQAQRAHRGFKVQSVRPAPKVSRDLKDNKA
jgi:hypothetical protein